MRSRPWALEEALFGPGSGIARHRALEALEADLAAEQSELVRIAQELHRQASRIAGLKRQLAVLTTQVRGAADWWLASDRAVRASVVVPA